MSWEAPERSVSLFENLGLGPGTRWSWSAETRPHPWVAAGDSLGPCAKLSESDSQSVPLTGLRAGFSAFPLSLFPRLPQDGSRGSKHHKEGSWDRSSGVSFLSMCKVLGSVPRTSLGANSFCPNSSNFSPQTADAPVSSKIRIHCYRKKIGFSLTMACRSHH